MAKCGVSTKCKAQGAVVTWLQVKFDPIASIAQSDRTEEEDHQQHKWQRHSDQHDPTNRFDTVLNTQQQNYFRLSLWAV